MTLEITTECSRLIIEGRLSPKDSRVKTIFFQHEFDSELELGGKGGCNGIEDRCPLGYVCSHDVRIFAINRGIVQTYPLLTTDSIAEYYASSLKIKVVFEGNRTQFEKSDWLVSIMLEMMDNCVRNRISGSVEGASEITITFGENEFRVEDNFEYPNPEEILRFLQGVVTLGRPHTSRPSDKYFERPIGGSGIYGALKTLQSKGGGLEYYIKGKTIGVRMLWKENL
jgi:hypothetical protein